MTMASVEVLLAVITQALWLVITVVRAAVHIGKRRRPAGDGQPAPTASQGGGQP